MTVKKRFQVLIVGGGLAGLTAAVHLSKEGIDVVLIEKSKYPYHKVCGEYISNEVIPYLNRLGIDPFENGAVPISKLEISNATGNTIKTSLPLGGFGISRYTLDHSIYNLLKDRIKIVFDTVENIQFQSNYFTISTKNKKTFEAQFVIGAYGKRSNIDINLQRNFIQKRTHWIGIKAHYNFAMPSDTVGLHNFEGGYCGLSKVEDEKVNACYLTTQHSVNKASSIVHFQKIVLSKNPILDHFFNTAIPLFEKPLAISQISFEQKEPVDQHIFMVGDSAGLIHPLCGNGMAMAIHSAKLFSELFLKFTKGEIKSRQLLEQTYTLKWKENFNRRLQTGKLIQQLLMNPTATKLGLKVAELFPKVIPTIIKKTHGDLLV